MILPVSSPAMKEGLGPNSQVMAEDERKELIFRDINADDEQQTTEVESLCMNCHENVSMPVCIQMIESRHSY